MIGTTLGDVYRVTREIGRGGMGAVYEGIHLRLNRRVAVKVMARELATNAEALARFRREAEVTSQLGHPHIVQVFDFGQAPSGEPYLVMEYLEGEDLEQRIQRVGPLSVDAAVHIVKQIASALGATHAKGIVHRDLKPANIFVLSVEGETDFVKVVDFGISKVKAATTRLTAAAAVMGTPNYMSPEQAAGRVDEIDQGTDQWALACIAYEMLAGRPPFIGENVASLLYQVVHEAPSPLAASAPGLPPGIEEVLGAALAKRPADRFASITAFARAFEGAATGVEGVGATLPASAAIAPVSPAPRQAPVTTFSAAVGEASRDGATATSGSRRWLAPVVGLVAVAAGVALVARPHAPPPATTAAVSAPAPSPVAVPAPPPAPVSAPAEVPPPPTAPAPAQPSPSSSAHARRRNGGKAGGGATKGAKASDSPATAAADAPTWPPPSATPTPAPTPAPSRPSSYPPPPGSSTYPPPPGSAPAAAPPQQKRHLVHDLKTKLFGD